MERKISELIEYAVRKGWLTEGDRVWAANRVLEALEMDGFEGLMRLSETEELPEIADILQALCEDAHARGVIEGDSAAYTDLLDTKLMGLLLPRPSEIAFHFEKLYEKSPAQATDWYYAFSGDTNYIRRDRIAKDRKWTVDTEYGTIDITINLSKPEKDPKAIAAAGKAKATGYPKCLLCVENEGYAGTLTHPARQNHRIIPMPLNGQDFFLQYSPYVYYNEHCIVFNKLHTPMHIDEQAFGNLLDFVTHFPHYFVGSNADLPIVGGSVLSHDHYQGGRYTFAMERAEIEKALTFPGFEDVTAGIVKWPMSVIRLRAADKNRLIQLATRILAAWRAYDDPSALILHETEGTPHNTITPIARRRGEDYELDLVLRNNRTTEEFPLGIFHPHAEKHHIKKENIGLIEVMGLAVLPARLKLELAAVADLLVAGKAADGQVAEKVEAGSLSEKAVAALAAKLQADALTASHADWALEVAQKHPELTAENAMEIVQHEVGLVFAAVLEDAGVFKRDEAGQAAFLRFAASI
ncbi:MAG: UDP-glucose--hexose-1-phosphate uridylyltransferase [Lachnospiraceae bacterium]|nr:UDP-glucose--hexose-1-phosphate uridylyltransferase [Lachnospiraceae bacterium]